MKNNKTAWAVTLLLVLLTAAAGLTIKFWPRTVPTEQCSLIYRKYANMPGIKATYIKDYPLNDITTVNVTTIQATTDSAWLCLLHDFITDSLLTKHQNQLQLKNAIQFSIQSKLDYHKPADISSPEGFDLIALSTKQSSVSIFHTENISQLRAIISIQTQTLSSK